MSNFNSSPNLSLGMNEFGMKTSHLITSMPVDKEQTRIAEIAQGNNDALVSLIADWKKPMYAYFYRSLYNSADAEDLTQKLFHRIYRAAGSYQPKGKFSSWLFTIARNLLIDELKKKSRRPNESTLLEYQIADESRSSKEELHEILAHELNKLSENHRTALLLRVQQELSYREIAEIMHTNESNVKTWIFRARTVLRKSIKLHD